MGRASCWLTEALFDCEPDNFAEALVIKWWLRNDFRQCCVRIGFVERRFVAPEHFKLGGVIEKEFFKLGAIFFGYGLANAHNSFVVEVLPHRLDNSG